jgi:hypothetical protein
MDIMQHPISLAAVIPVLEPGSGGTAAGTHFEITHILPAPQRIVSRRTLVGHRTESRIRRYMHLAPGHTLIGPHMSIGGMCMVLGADD